MKRFLLLIPAAVAVLVLSGSAHGDDCVPSSIQTCPPSTTTTTTRAPVHLVFTEDTVLVDEVIVLRPGDTIELRNEAQLTFGSGATLDAQGSEVFTWSLDEVNLQPNGDPTLVSNLERDVDIFGSGDLLFAAGSLPATIRYVEVDLQPKREDGHYPIHWHFAGTSPAGSLVEGTVVRDSTNRCIVPHGVTGITIRDSICYSITGDAIWWDPPIKGDRDHVANNSHSIVVDRVLVDTVHVGPGGNQNRNFAFELQSGVGNVIINSVAKDVAGVSHSGGYYWPSDGNLNVDGSNWTFTNNVSYGESLNCSYFWMNGKRPIDFHLQTDLRCYGGDVGNGAYTAPQEYDQLVGTGTLHIYAGNGHFHDSELGDVLVRTPAAPGDKHPVLIEDSTLRSFVIRETQTLANRYHWITVNNVTLEDGTPFTCAHIVVESKRPETQVWVDGVACL